VRYESWGRWIPSEPARVIPLQWTSSIPRFDAESSVLAYGMGRSYGDVCLNNGSTLLDTRGLSRFRRLDDDGILECEAGATLEDILRLVVPRGWFVPVTPGTKFVTLGGCIANDVHGKNHHRAGTFGRYVRSFQLLRSDGSLVRCSRDENVELYRATIGGLGLTGLVVTVELQLRRIASPMMRVEQLPFHTIDEFESISRASDAYDYTVAWFDCFGGRAARGIFFRGNHEAEWSAAVPAAGPAASRRRFPVGLFAPFLVPLTVRAFNALYYHAQKKSAPRAVHYEPFFYPLDRLANWNALYGRHGFMQYQCVIPHEAGLEPVKAILDRTASSRRSSFLTVIKTFGDIESPGLLSFPRPGTTVCLDFAAGETSLLTMLEGFDDVVEEARGSVYPAKDSRMSPKRFRTFFPQWEQLAALADPKFSSTFWRRVTS